MFYNISELNKSVDISWMVCYILIYRHLCNNPKLMVDLEAFLCIQGPM